MISVKFKPTIELNPINIPYQKDISDDKAQIFVDKIGQYPFVFFGGLILEYQYFIDFKLFNDDFLPRLEMKFKDLSYKMIDPLFPLDDSVISVFIKSSDENLRPIRMDFKIVEFNPIKNNINNEDITYSLVGYLNVNKLYFSNFCSYKGTSFDVLQTLAKEINIGFASNIESTNDNQAWINPAETKINFIKNITKGSYKSDEAFLLSYIDFYYNLNYVDIETQYSDSTDIAGITNDSYILKNPDNKLIPLCLTNHPDYRNTNMYISKYNILNESTNVNLDIGYFAQVTYYKKIEKEINIFNLDTISTVGDSNTIILKSNSNTSSENLNNFGGEHVYYGTVDTDNIHENFYYSLLQNERNIKYFQKIRIKLILKQPNFNLYRFQMIKVNIYKMQEMDSKDRFISSKEDLKKDAYADKINKRLSGDWMIIGINYVFSPSDGWEQEINLSKRELNVSEL